MKCPRDQSSLTGMDYEGVHIESCPSCGGEWLDADELGPIVKARQMRFSDEECRALATAGPMRGVRLEDVDHDLQCPKCGTETDPLHYGGDSGVILEKCPNCGSMWLDHDELEKVQKLIEGWEDQLPEDVQRFRDKLKQVAAEVDAGDDVAYSRIGWVNACINGMLDFARL